MIKRRFSFLLILDFFLLILLGGYLLTLPQARLEATPLSFLDACFTANSALCNTALTVTDISQHFSFWGQLLILILIQLGGLSFMAFTTFLVLIFRKKMFVSERLLLMEAFNFYSWRDLKIILCRIFSFVFIAEAVGAIILFLCFLPEKSPSQALFWGIFHSVSAFNNAGLALTGNGASLTPYVGDWIVNLTISALIIMGGIGFIVVTDLLRFQRWSLHTKVVMAATVFLILFGTIAFYVLEHTNPATLGTLSQPHKILASFFQAVTARTAGFSTVALNHLAPGTTLLLMLLMFVGASPGGTGGGLKTVTFVLLAATIWATLRNSKNTILFNRRIPPETVRRAITITFLASLVIALAVFSLNYTESFNLTQLSFEVVSAFSAVGLSMGITSQLSFVGKIIIMAMIFIGRFGILSLLVALLTEQKEAALEPPKEGVSIG